MANKNISVDIKSLGIAWVRGTQYDIRLEENFVHETASSAQPNPAVTLRSITTNSEGPILYATYPSGFGDNTGGYQYLAMVDVSYFHFVYNRTSTSTVGTGNIRLYKVVSGGTDELVYSFSITDTSVRNNYSSPYVDVTNGTYLGRTNINLWLSMANRAPTTGEFPGFLPDTYYYFLIDAGVIIDTDGFPSPAITDNKLLRLHTTVAPYPISGSPQLATTDVDVWGFVDGTTGPAIQVTMNRNIQVTSGATVSLYKTKDGNSSLVQTFTYDTSESAGTFSQTFAGSNYPYSIILHGTQNYVRDPSTKYYVLTSTDAFYDSNRFKKTLSSDTDYYFTTYAGPALSSSISTPPSDSSGYINNVFIKLRFNRLVKAGTGKINLYSYNNVTYVYTLVKSFDPTNTSEVTFTTTSPYEATVWVRGYLAADTTYTVELEQSAVEDTYGIGCTRKPHNTGAPYSFSTASALSFHEIRGGLFSAITLTATAYVRVMTKATATLSSAFTLSCNPTKILAADVLGTSPSDYGYVEDTIGTISPSLIVTDFTYTGTANYTVVITPSNTAAVKTIGTTASGGTTTFDNTAKTFTIIGTRTVVNNHLNALRLLTGTDYASNFTLTYAITSPTHGSISKVQNINLATPYDSEISNLDVERKYIGNQETSIFSPTGTSGVTNAATPRITDFDTSQDYTYTISLHSDIGQFGYIPYGGGPTYYNTLSISGTRSQFNGTSQTGANDDISLIYFRPTPGTFTTDGNVASAGSFTWTTLKAGTQIAQQTVNLHKVSDYLPVELTGSYTTSYQGYTGTLISSSLAWSQQVSDTVTFTLTGISGIEGFASYSGTAAESYQNDYSAGSLSFTGTSSEISAWLARVKVYPVKNRTTSISYSISYTGSGRTGTYYSQTKTLSYNGNVSGYSSYSRTVQITGTDNFIPTVTEQLYYVLSNAIYGAGGGGGYPVNIDSGTTTPMGVGAGGGGGQLYYSYRGPVIPYYVVCGYGGAAGTVSNKSGNNGGNTIIYYNNNQSSITASGGYGAVTSALPVGGSSGGGNNGTTSTLVDGTPVSTRTGGNGGGDSNSQSGLSTSGGGGGYAYVNTSTNIRSLSRGGTPNPYTGGGGGGGAFGYSGTSGSGTFTTLSPTAGADGKVVFYITY
jgi:hypothetical protein